jgi:hypothetical protein
MTYIVLDQGYNQVAAKHGCYTYHQYDRPAYSVYDLPEGPRNPPYIAGASAIKDACAMLSLKAADTRLRLNQSLSKTSPQPTRDYKYILPQMLQEYASGKVIFTARKANVRLPDLPSESNVPGFFAKLLLAWQMRTIQISMVGHRCGPDGERYFSSVFYVLAFKLFEEGYEPSKLGAPFVDLTMVTSN